MKSIAAHPRNIPRIAFAVVDFAGVVSCFGEATKETGDRRVAPHFVQKMSPVSAKVPHCVQTTFCVMLLIEMYHTLHRSCCYHLLLGTSKDSDDWVGHQAEKGHNSEVQT